MKTNNDQETAFEFNAAFKARALELLDESLALQFSEGLRLGSALSHSHAREYRRLEKKYGKDHPRTLEVADRITATESLKNNLYSRYTEASTPFTDPGEGWAVDGFVRTLDGEPIAGITVAAYDRNGRWQKKLGYACSNDKGYFSITTESIPDKEINVFMRPSKENKLLSANEVQLVPESGSSDRVEIIIGGSGGADDCMSPAGEKDRSLPPDQPAETVKEKSHTIEPLELSEIKGMGPQRVKKLETADIKDVESFIATDDNRLIEILGNLDFATMKTDARSKLGACYLGNKNTKEIHDLNCLKKQCQVDEIKKEHRMFFRTQKEATEAGYDFCAYCFGKDKSKR